MASNRIHARGPHRQVEYPVETADTIYPGYLVALNSSGNVIVHATEGGRAERLFATEDPLQGRTISDLYAVADEPCTCILPELGSEVYAMIEDGQDIAIGDLLISSGNGKLKELSDADSPSTVVEVLAIALEAQDLTGSNSSDSLTLVRIVAG